jgi:hypothetical protein
MCAGCGPVIGFEIIDRTPVEMSEFNDFRKLLKQEIMAREALDERVKKLERLRLSSGNIK